MGSYLAFFPRLFEILEVIVSPGFAIIVSISRSLRWGIILAILGAVVAGAYWIGRATINRADQPEALAVDTALLDFGEVWENRAFVWSLPIENRSGGPVRVVEFVSSCGCLAVDPGSLKLAPGEAAAVRLTLDLARRNMQEPGDEQPAGTGVSVQGSDKPTMVRKFATQIQARVQGEHGGWLNQLPWTIQGRVRKALTLTPGSVTFADSLVRGQPYPTRSVRVTAHTPLQLLKPHVNPALATLELESLSGNEYDLRIRPRDPLPAKDFAFTIILQAVTSDGETLPELPLSVEGKVLEDIQATPNMIILGAQLQGNVVQDTIMLRSLAGQTFGVEATECSAKGLTIELKKSMPSVKEYRLTHVIEETGQRSCVIHFTVRARGSLSAQVIPVKVNYLGLAK